MICRTLSKVEADDGVKLVDEADSKYFALTVKAGECPKPVEKKEEKKEETSATYLGGAAAAITGAVTLITNTYM